MAEELISKVEAVRNADKRDIDGEIKALRENRKAVEGTLVDLLKSGEYKDWKRALEKLEKIREERPVIARGL
jgi:hypothetical protein